MTETKPTTIFLSSTPEGAVVQIFQCKKQWDELQATRRADVRSCDHCHQEVHRVVDVDGFERAVVQGQCVMVAGYERADAKRKLFVGKSDSISYEVTAAPPVQED